MIGIMGEDNADGIGQALIVLLHEPHVEIAAIGTGDSDDFDRRTSDGNRRDLIFKQIDAHRLDVRRDQVAIVIAEDAEFSVTRLDRAGESLDCFQCRPEMVFVFVEIAGEQDQIRLRFIDQLDRAIVLPRPVADEMHVGNMDDF